jgi:ribose/xylose/arabinose/galactoside ABC-type transport system permease subunit
VSSVGPKSVPARPLAWSPQLVIQRYGVYCSLALLLLVALIIRPEVYRPESLFLILRSASQLGMVALGQTLVMLVAGLDLSVSGLIVLTSVVIAQVGVGQDSHILPALMISLIFGALIGMANGLLITKRNVPPFVATLGMLVLIRGAQSAYTQGIPSGQVPDGLKLLNRSLGPLPVSFVIWVAFTALLAFILYATPFGRRVYAIGSNREAARLSGIPVDRYIIAVYIICSLLVVGSGIILSGYVGYVDRYLGRGFDLDSIAAAVVGGAAFSGGRGSLVAAMAGVLLVQFLGSLLLIIGMDVQAQLIVKGVVVIGAVALYSLAGRRS